MIQLSEHHTPSIDVRTGAHVHRFCHAVAMDVDSRGPYVLIEHGGTDPFTVRPDCLPDLIAALQKAHDAYQDAK